MIGRIASEIDHRVLEETNNNLARFLIAVKKKNRFSASGVEASNFIPVVVWRQNADFVSKYLTKGSLITVEGYINVSRYTSKTTGSIVERLEVVGEIVESLEPRSVNEIRKASKAKEQLEEDPIIPNEEFSDLSSMFGQSTPQNKLLANQNQNPQFQNQQPQQQNESSQQNEEDKKPFGKFKGSATDFIESLRLKSANMNKDFGRKLKPIESNQPPFNIPKKPKPVANSVEIVTEGKKNEKIKSIMKSIWEDEK